MDRELERTSEFKRDFRRAARGRYKGTLEADLTAVLDDLRRDRTLPRRYADHPLGGALKGFRECHLRPDLLLIYKKLGSHTLQLIRLGSHSDLFA